MRVCTQRPSPLHHPTPQLPGHTFLHACHRSEKPVDAHADCPCLNCQWKGKKSLSVYIQTIDQSEKKSKNHSLPIPAPKEKSKWRTKEVFFVSVGFFKVMFYCLPLAESIYMCGGFDGHTRHTSMERYDPKTDKWTMLSGMAIGREGAGLVVAGDMIYCIGGYDGISLLDSAERYDPSSEQWTSIPCMTIQRSGA